MPFTTFVFVFYNGNVLSSPNDTGQKDIHQIINVVIISFQYFQFSKSSVFYKHPFKLLQNSLWRW